MSYNIHEAVCLDSMRVRLDWNDHFEGDSVKSLWRVAGVGSAPVVDGVDGAAVRLTTGGATGNTYAIDWNDVRTLLVSKKVTMEWRAKLSSTLNVGSEMALWFNSQNRIMVYISGANWRIRCENNNLDSNFASGVATDTDYHIFRIGCFPTGEVHFYIDDVETANSPITTNIPPDYLMPLFDMFNTADETKLLDIDYVVIRQER